MHWKNCISQFRGRNTCYENFFNGIQDGNLYQDFIELYDTFQPI